MKIHELTSFSGTPGENDYLAIDNGSETSKVPATALGITTEMTEAEAQEGASTDARVITAKTLSEQIDSTIKSLFESLGWTQDSGMNVVSSLLKFIGGKIKDSEDLVIRRTYTYTNTTALSPGSIRTITGNDVGASTPEGYVALGVRQVYISGTNAVDLISMRLTLGNSQFVAVRNAGSSSVTDFTVQVGVSYIKNGYWKDLAE